MGWSIFCDSYKLHKDSTVSFKTASADQRFQLKWINGQFETCLIWLLLKIHQLHALENKFTCSEKNNISWKNHSLNNLTNQPQWDI